jgi:hypothetical protein
MTRFEFWKIALSGSLLFFISFMSLVSNTDKIMHSNKVVEVPFTNVYEIDGVEYLEVSFKSDRTPRKTQLEWFIKDLINKLSIPIILLIVLINPQFPKWVWFMWFLYFSFIMIDWVLFFERWPWRYTIDSLICSAQLLYTVNLARNNFIEID